MRTLSKAAALCAVLLALLALCGCGRQEPTELPGLTVVFPKIGSADCAILMTDDTTVLIDTGEDKDAEDILRILKGYGRTEIDLMLISHYDKDHVGGADRILGAMPVHRVIGSTSPKDSDDYRDYQEALRAAGLTEEIPTQDISLSLNGMEFTLLPPECAEYDTDQSNNSSVVVSLTYGRTRMLFCGDAMAERTAEFLPRLSGRYDLIKLPHHGRDADTAADISRQAGSGDTVYIITSSKKEPESSDVLALLPGAILTRNGDVTAYSDGITLTVSQDS